MVGYYTALHHIAILSTCIHIPTTIRHLFLLGKFCSDNRKKGNCFLYIGNLCIQNTCIMIIQVLFIYLYVLVYYVAGE